MKTITRGQPGLTAAIALVVLATIGAVAIAVLRVLAGPGFGSQADYLPFNVVVALAFGYAGLAVVHRNRRNPLGWLFIAGGLGNALAGLGVLYAYFALVRYPATLPAGELGLWLFSWAWMPVPLSILFTLALFPDGRPLTRRWRPLIWVLAVAGGLWVVVAATGKLPGSGLSDWTAHRANPFALPFTEALQAPVTITVLGCGVLAAASLILRFRRARGDERQQLKWLTVSAVPIVLAFLTFTPIDFGIATIYVSAAVVVLFLAPIILAITRYRLYDVDLVINRALVYGTLSVLLLATYVVLVSALGRLFGQDQTLLVHAATTVAVALSVLPFRQAVQSLVNTLLYGKRREPVALAAMLSRRLEMAGSEGDLLRETVEELSASLKLQGLAVLSPAGQVEASAGRRGKGEASCDLIHQGELLGTLVATPLSGDALSSRDTKLLARLAPQLAIALRVSVLNGVLQNSRERLVSALESERRRLRRDLHDGLGPVLTAAGLRADAARNVLEREPEEAAKLLLDLRGDLTAAMAEVRRLVYGLRPPALDELGLVEALRDGARALVASADETGVMEVDIRAPEPLGPLPAAVEVAAFRIALEAVTNAARHGRARMCVVNLSVNGALLVEVRDDGAGLGSPIRPGFGLTSMRERAAAAAPSISPRCGARGRASSPACRWRLRRHDPRHGRR